MPINKDVGVLDATAGSTLDRVGTDIQRITVAVDQELLKMVLDGGGVILVTGEIIQQARPTPWIDSICAFEST